MVDAVAFRQDWEMHGPTVPGLDPIDAADRLKKFSQMFEVRKRKWNNYTSGEELFGLAITQYPELEKTEKEIQSAPPPGAHALLWRRQSLRGCPPPAACSRRLRALCPGRAKASVIVTALPGAGARQCWRSCTGCT